MSEKNSLKGVRIEYHILQSFPVSCLNRDDVGAPKTAMIGGTIRARISSQCWKRQVRLAMRDLGISIGSRTKLIKKLIEDACVKEGATQEQAALCGVKVEQVFIKKEDKESDSKAKDVDNEEENENNGDEKLKTDTLLFLSPHEARILAQAFKAEKFDPDKVVTQKDHKKQAKDIEKILEKKMNFSIDGLDIALFGRMVAQAAELNVEAAASFSHAISTHKAANEVEFFTALDDINNDPGAAHMGSLEFNSATYYRYISLDLGQLFTSLVGEKIIESIEAFTKALFIAIPSARQTSQAASCPWQFARVLIRRGQRIQAPFDTAVIKKKNEGGFLEPSKEELKGFLENQEKLWGSLFDKIAVFDFNEGKDTGIDQLVSFLKTSIGKVLK